MTCTRPNVWPGVDSVYAIPLANVYDGVYAFTWVCSRPYCSSRTTFVLSVYPWYSWGMSEAVSVPNAGREAPTHNAQMRTALSRLTQIVHPVKHTLCRSLYADSCQSLIAIRLRFLSAKCDYFKWNDYRSNELIPDQVLCRSFVDLIDISVFFFYSWINLVLSICNPILHLLHYKSAAL